MNKMSPMKVTVVFLLSGSKNPQEPWMDGNTLVKWSRDWRVCPVLLVIHKRQKSCIVISKKKSFCVVFFFLVLFPVRLHTLQLIGQFS